MCQGTGLGTICLSLILTAATGNAAAVFYDFGPDAGKPTSNASASSVGVALTYPFTLNKIISGLDRDHHEHRQSVLRSRCHCKHLRNQYWLDDRNRLWARSGRRTCRRRHFGCDHIYRSDRLQRDADQLLSHRAIRPCRCRICWTITRVARMMPSFSNGAARNGYPGSFSLMYRPSD